jgi:metal-responsive CopG/Arc/MetJ family transcriptional regulator
MVYPTYLTHMRAIQVMMDEALLQRLDSDPEVGRRGRSAVLREAVAEYLRRRDEARLAEAYRRAYTEQPPDEFSDWADAAASGPDE